MAAKFLPAVLAQPKVKRLISSDHFSVDGTLIEAWAKQPKVPAIRRIAGKAAEGSIKSFRRKDRKDGGDDDSEARLYKKGDGEPARLCDIGHILMENSNGLAVDGGVTQAGGTAEREAALAMLDRRKRRGRITLGADKAYDVRQFVEDLRDRLVTPHIAIDGHLSKTGKPRATAMDGRTTCRPGYEISQRFRKRIAEVFGWAKGSAGLAKVKLRGQAKVDAVFTLTLAAYILFENNGSGEFAFGCSTGHIWQASSTDATSIDFSRSAPVRFE